MKLTGFLCLFLINSLLYAAVTIVECEDNQGERSFQATCPPGSTQIDSRKINTGVDATASDTDEAVINVTLYVVPECTICEDVKYFLETKDVALTIKDASTEQIVQEELKALTGVLRVPVVSVGDRTVTGFNRTDIEAALQAAGYTPASE